MLKTVVPWELVDIGTFGFHFWCLGGLSVCMYFFRSVNDSILGFLDPKESVSSRSFGFLRLIQSGNTDVFWFGLLPNHTVHPKTFGFWQVINFQIWLLFSNYLVDLKCINFLLQWCFKLPPFHLTVREYCKNMFEKGRWWCACAANRHEVRSHHIIHFMKLNTLDASPLVHLARKPKIHLSSCGADFMALITLISMAIDSSLAEL